MNLIGFMVSTNDRRFGQNVKGSKREKDHLNFIGSVMQILSSVPSQTYPQIVEKGKLCRMSWI